MPGKNFKIAGLVSALTLSLTLGACSSGSASGESEIELGGEDIEIPYSDAGSTVRSLVLADALEDVGYDVSLTQVQSDGSLYAATASSEDALHASGWFPSTHEDYLDQYGDDIEVYTDNDIIEDASISLAVPEYMEDVNSIEDLKDNDELGESVDWTINGIDPRSGIMQKTDDAIEDNGLGDYDLEESSEMAMISELQEKYENQAPMIFTSWQPHWIFNTLDLKMLDDPENIYDGSDEHINFVFNSSFENEHPAAYKIATRMADDWSQSDEDELMESIFVDQDNQEDTIDNFMEDNSNRIDDWKEDVEGQ